MTNEWHNEDLKKSSGFFVFESGDEMVDLELIRRVVHVGDHEVVVEAGRWRFGRLCNIFGTTELWWSQNIFFKILGNS